MSGFTQPNPFCLALTRPVGSLLAALLASTFAGPASALNRNMQIIYVRTGAVIHGFHPLGYERIRGVAPAVLAVVPDRSRAAEPPG